MLIPKPKNDICHKNKSCNTEGRDFIGLKNKE